MAAYLAERMSPRSLAVLAALVASRRLISASLLMGAASTAIWSFGGELVRQQLDWGANGAALLWSLVGASGLLGASAGSLIARYGLNRIHRLSLVALAAAIVAIGCYGYWPWLMIAGGALFGAAYILPHR